jgi:hypothetical protein
VTWEPSIFCACGGPMRFMLGRLLADEDEGRVVLWGQCLKCGYATRAAVLDEEMLARPSEQLALW